MPEYLSPGVYIEEIEIGAKPIEGVSTSTAGFLGEAERGPTRPQFITSWADYMRKFGEFFGAGHYLPFAVQGFFNNGGQRCYISRVVKSGAASATTATLKLQKDAADALTVRAFGEGDWGNRVIIKVTEGTQSGFRVSVFYWKTLPEPLYDPERDNKTRPRPQVIEVFDDLSVEEASPDAYHKKLNGISNLIEISVETGDAGVIPELTHGTAQSGGADTITLAADAPATDDVYNGLTIRIAAGAGDGQVRTITDYDGSSKQVTVDSNWDTQPDSTSEYQIYWFLALEGGYDSLVHTGTAQGAGSGTDTIVLAGDASGDDDVYNDLQIAIIAGTGAGQAKTIQDYTGSSQEAQVDSDWETAPDATSAYLINDPVLVLADYERLDTAQPGKRKGLTSFTQIDDISIVYAPNAEAVSGLSAAIITHCETLKDRFAIIDASRASANIAAITPRDSYDTEYAGFYYPWIKVIDAASGLIRTIPPGGHVAGIYARSDTERGVHKAPANEVVRGVTDLEFQINKGEHDVLNPRGVNVIRAFPGRGIRLWGARTLSSDPLWKYVNVRRLFLFLEESIQEGTQWVVFEPNDRTLWARVRQSVSQFLTNVWKDGALMGATPEEAYFVKCDRTTMTQNDIDNGRLIVLIGVAPVKPAEFVIFRIAQWQGGAAVTE